MKMVLNFVVRSESTHWKIYFMVISILMNSTYFLVVEFQNLNFTVYKEEKCQRPEYHLNLT